MDLVPPEVFELKEHRGQVGQTDCESGLSETIRLDDNQLMHIIYGVAVNFSEYDNLPSGQVSLINRVKYVAPPLRSGPYECRAWVLG